MPSGLRQRALNQYNSYLGLQNAAPSYDLGGASADDKQRTAQFQQMRERLMKTLLGQATGSPLDTQFFTQGMGNLRDNLKGQGRRDEQALAARGMQGGEMSLAALGSRNQSLVSGQRGLVQGAAQDQDRKKALLQSLIGQGIGDSQRQQSLDQGAAYRQYGLGLQDRGLDLERYAIDRGYDEQARNRRSQLFGSLIGGGIGLFA